MQLRYYAASGETRFCCKSSVSPCQSWKNPHCGWILPCSIAFTAFRPIGRNRPAPRHCARLDTASGEPTFIIVHRAEAGERHCVSGTSAPQAVDSFGESAPNITLGRSRRTAPAPLLSNQAVCIMMKVRRNIFDGRIYHVHIQRNRNQRAFHKPLYPDWEGMDADHRRR